MIEYSALRKAPRLDLATEAPLPWPLCIYIEPTNICNFDCSFCPQSLLDYKDRADYHQHMDISLYLKLIEEIRAQGGVKSLKLYFFGEPLLHPEIGTIAKLADTASERVEITTNGTPLSARCAEQLVDAETDYLRVSIYPDLQNPALIRRNVERLRRLRDQRGKRKPYIFIKVLTPEELLPVREFYGDIADEVGCEGLHSIGSDMIQIRALTGSQVACPFPFYTLVVKANGDVVPCCVAWETSLVVGNAKYSSLVDIWRGERLAAIHRLHLAGRRDALAACRNCDTLFNTPDSVDGLTAEEYDRRRAMG